MSIHLGFEVCTGRAVEIPLRHTAVTGQTQESGKTTTLEGLITRSKLRGLAYITKRGESSFHVKKSIPPYFRERTDWQFVAAILEATMSERLKFQRSWIMKLCEARHAKNENWAAPRTLADVMRNTDSALEKARGMNESVYYELREYLRLVVPQIDRLPYSTRLEMVPGVNVMDLTAYEFPMQALVVRSCIEWIRAHERDTINVIPEAWKFAPKQRNSPVRLAAEEYIREGAALRNFLWLDSQDIAGVADVLLRQIGVWIFGVQRAKHEIERTLDHIPEGLLARRPRAGDVATLGKGQFFVCFGREMYKVYVQPAWMKAAHAEAIARGEEPVESARDVLKDYEEEHPDVTDGNEQQRETDAGAGAPREGVRLPALQSEQASEPDHKDGRGGFGPSDRGAQRGHDPAGGEAYGAKGQMAIETEEAMSKTMERLRAIASHNSDIEWLLEQYDAVVAAHDALAERIHKLEFAAGSPEPVRPAPLPSPAAGPGDRAAEAEPGAEHQSGPAPGVSPNRIDSLPHHIYKRIYAFVKDCASKDPGVLELLRNHPELHVRVSRPRISADADTLQGKLALLISEKFFDQARALDAVRAECLRRGFFGIKTPNQQLIVAIRGLTEMGFLTSEAAGFQSVAGMRVLIEEEKAVAAR